MAILAARRHVMTGADRASASSVAHALAADVNDAIAFELTGRDGTLRRIEVTPLLAQAIRSLVDVLATTGAAAVVDEDEELSPGKAAELLGVSRPTVVQKINQGQLRSRMVGTHHRIRMSDLLSFQAGEPDRIAALEEFGEQTDELTMRHGF